MTRVYVPTPLESGAQVPLERGASDHLLRVLRLAPGAPLVVFDGRGGEFRASLERIERHTAVVAVREHVPIERESPVAITLLQGLARGERMDWVVQKATELGVTRIVPISAGRSVVRLDTPRAEARVVHWRAVAASACEQCGRNRLPDIVPPLRLADALATIADIPLRIVMSANDGASLTSLVSPRAQWQQVALLAGPEGGLDDDEMRMALDGGLRAIRLGPRTLRTETAGLVAVTAVQVLAGDLAPGSCDVRAASTADSG